MINALALLTLISTGGTPQLSRFMNERAPGLATHRTILSATETKALGTTSQLVVPAPGENRVVVLVDVVLKLVAGSEVLAESGDNLQIQYGTSGGVVTDAIETTGFIDNATDLYGYKPSKWNGVTALNVAQTENAALHIAGTANDFTENASDDAQLIIWVTYHTLAVP